MSAVHRPWKSPAENALGMLLVTGNEGGSNQLAAAHALLGADANCAPGALFSNLITNY